MHENDYLNELKSGKQLRIKYDGKFSDGCADEGWWSEELFCYDRNTDMFKCYYPKSSYDKEFYTIHNENSTKYIIQDSIWSHEHGTEDVPRATDFILEECNIPVISLSIRELAIQKINSMTDDELRRILSI